MDYSFKTFQKKALIRELGLDKYNKIINMFNDDSIKLTSKEFKEVFNSFYGIRRDDDWQEYYYSFFNENRKNYDIKFSEILDYLYKYKDPNGKIKNYVDISFASKMLSTINNDMPIWDQHVRRNLKINVKGNKRKEKLANAKLEYDNMQKKIMKILKRQDVKDAIKDFRNFFPEYHFSRVKILDFILWNYRGEK